EVVSRLMALRDLNPATAQVVSPKHRKFIGSQSKQRMDAQDIANRLMRKDNYLIALFNKDILDLTLPIPFMKHRQLFSRTLEWNLNICILDFVFNEQGQVRPIFLKDTHRKPLSQALRRRFLVIGILNVFIAPFLVAYFLMHHFFRYFNEYQKNPSLVGSRQYTPLAEWKFREFNELSHLFQRRINMSYPFASRYIDQFPKDKTIQLARFVGFIAGAIASVLALASVIDPELFLGFEITPDRTVLFYLGIFGSIWAGARGMVPEKTLVFDPEFALREVIDYTHYQPSHWRGKLHSDEVRRDFAIMYQMKVVIFMEEILSMIIAPFVLCFSLPHCSDQIIDFFREFTIHVDGLGYICSFAEFNFQKGVNAIAQERPSRCGTGDPRGNYFSTKDNKLLASYFGFLDNYGDNNLAPAHRHRASRWSPISVNSPGLAPTVLRNDLGDRTYSPARRAGSKRVAAPMRSFLLDPHHQPCSASGFRPAPLLRPAVPNQRKSSQRSLLRQHHRFPASASVMGTPPVARKDFAQSPHTSALDVNHGGGGSGDDDGVDDMDASWKSHLDENAENDENDHDNGDDVQNLVEGPGVLGLMKQLQKATN
ncbi:autophagy protein atg9, partial [Ascosphaera aggregata]